MVGPLIFKIVWITTHKFVFLNLYIDTYQYMLIMVTTLGAHFLMQCHVDAFFMFFINCI